MKKIAVFLLLLTVLALAVPKKLGYWYRVKNDKSYYFSIEGEKIKYRQRGELLRLIRDESVAETVLMVPVRLVNLLFAVTPRGTWLMEDNNSNRGYMWKSDLELLTDQNR